MMPELKTIVVVAGYPGVGKSAVCRHLRDNYGFHLARVEEFHDPVMLQFGGRFKYLKWLLKKGRRQDAIVKAHVKKTLADAVGWLKRECHGRQLIVLDHLTGPGHLESIKNAFPNDRVVSLYLSAPTATRAFSVFMREVKPGVAKPEKIRVIPGALAFLTFEHSLRTGRRNLGNIPALYRLSDYRINRQIRPNSGKKVLARVDAIMNELGIPEQ